MQPEPRNRQVAMVLDLNKCLGCQTCTIACKKLWNRDSGAGYAYWNNVETWPGQGYPRRWQETGGRDAAGEVKRGEVPDLESGYGRAWKFDHQGVIDSDSRKGDHWLRPDGDPSWGPNWEEDHGAGTYPRDNHYFYLPRLCNHCTHPACLDACPRAAIGKRAEDGIVLVDQDRCHGYRFCVEACPYKKVFFDTERRVANKCLFCLPRVEQGVAPACARQCPGRLRFVGYLDDEAGPIHKLVAQWKVALPLHPEYGLEPNVFYVPPLSPPALDEQGRPTGAPRIPIETLEGLFGPAVRDALATIEAERAKRKRGQPSALMDLLIAYDWNDSFRLDPASHATPGSES
ncbi:MAG: 4Fe-4S dicluster domain-containing protein [Candidatus Binatia bacterium]